MADQLTWDTVVGADFSQFYIRLPRAVDWPQRYVDTGLAWLFEGAILLITARQWGQLPVSVNLWSDRPADLTDDWGDVVEVSLPQTEGVFVGGWEQQPDDLLVPLLSNAPHRVRYAIANMDDGDAFRAEPPYPERYRVDLWPEVEKPGAVMRQTSKAGRSWHVSRGMDLLRHEIVERRSQTEEARLEEFAERSFASYPELLSGAASGDTSTLKRMTSAAFMLVDRGSQIGYPDQDRMREIESRVTLVMQSVARRLTSGK